MTTEGALGQPQAEAQRPAPSDDKKTEEPERATKESALGQREERFKAQSLNLKSAGLSIKDFGDTTWQEELLATLPPRPIAVVEVCMS